MNVLLAHGEAQTAEETQAFDQSLSQAAGVEETHATTEAVHQSGGLAAGAEALGLNGKLLAAQIVNFVILLVILRQFLYKPLVGLLEQRRKQIEESAKKATEIEAKYQEFTIEHARRIDESKQEASSIIDSAKKAAESIRQETVSQAQAEVEGMLAKAQADINHAKEKMLAELKHEIGGLVVAATAKIIKKELDEKAQSVLIDEAVSEAKE